MIFRPVCEIASTIRSGSFHSKLPLPLPSMLRHSKRCLTQWNPPDRASCRSRAVVLALPHKNRWTDGSVVGSRAPADCGAAPDTAEGDAEAAAAGDAAAAG